MGAETDIERARILVRELDQPVPQVDMRKKVWLMRRISGSVDEVPMSLEIRMIGESGVAYETKDLCWEAIQQGHLREVKRYLDKYDSTTERRLADALGVGDSK